MGRHGKGGWCCRTTLSTVLWIAFSLHLDRDSQIPTVQQSLPVFTAAPRPDPAISNFICVQAASSTLRCIGRRGHARREHTTRRAAVASAVRQRHSRNGHRSSPRISVIDLNYFWMASLPSA